MSAPSASSSSGAAGSSVIDPTHGGLLPVVDGLWHEIYHVIAPREGGSENVQLWKAFRTDTAAEVTLRVFPGTKGDARADAFARLCEVDHPNLQKAREAQLVAGQRVEVTDALRGVSLAVWRSSRPGVDVATVETLVRQVSEALGSLHANGLVHLGLCPEVVFVQEEKGVLHFTLGGLDSVVRFEGDKLIPAVVNPLYAPPEAATLTLHEPGTGLCPWDWWTLGRLVQEMILGHHVIDDLMESVASKTEQMRRSHAEDLLLELDEQGPRAGAVEVMKEMEPRLNTLLRGLLASSPEGRWGGEFVDRWGQNKSVKENYNDRRIEQKFRWRGRLWTVPEAAKELQQEALWGEASMHVFKATTPGMLAHFIANTPEQHLVHKALGDLLKFAAGDPIKSLPAEASRELVLMLALLQMGGDGFTWKGRWIGGEALHTLLAEAPDNPARYAFVRVLTDRSITTMVEKNDLEAGRSLAAIAQVVTDAEATIRRQGWLKGKNEKEEEAIFRLALGLDTELKAAHERLRRDYASASDPVINKILKSDKPARGELVVVAWAETKATNLGLVTHAEMKSRRVGELTAKCDQITRVIFWQQLAKAMRPGVLGFGSPWLLLGVWLALLPVLAIHVPGLMGLLLGLLPCALIAGLRFGVHLALASRLKQWSPDTQLWAWWKQPLPRVRAEIARLAEKFSVPETFAETKAQLARSLTERTELAKPETPAPLVLPPSPTGAWTITALSWLLVVAVLGGSIWQGMRTPPSLKAHQKYWKEMFTSTEPDKPKLKPEEQLISWPYKAPSETPFEIITMGKFTPTGAQSRAAIERARALCKGYKPESMHSLVAIYTPLEGNNGGLLLYDGKKGAFLGQNGVLINFVPVPKMWMQIGDQRALFIEK